MKEREPARNRARALRGSRLAAPFALAAAVALLLVGPALADDSVAPAAAGPQPTAATGATGDSHQAQEAPGDAGKGASPDPTSEHTNPAPAAASGAGGESGTPARKAAADPAGGQGGNGAGAGGTAPASATAESKQDAPVNANVTVRVDRPGHDGPVAQANETTAQATASASSDRPADPSDDNGNNGEPEAHGSATSTQSTPTNLNVAIRVNSPGDSGAVEQANTARAAALAGVSGVVGSPSGPVASAGQADAQNVNVAIRIASPGNQGAVGQANTASATAGAVEAVGPSSSLAATPANASVDNSAAIDQSLLQCSSTCEGATPLLPPVATGQAPESAAADGSRATAIQKRPSNVNVTVRVASPGEDGSVSQSSAAVASAAKAVSTTAGLDNLDIVAVIPGEAIVGPSGTDPWVWSWTWTNDAAPAVADPAPTSTSSWDWAWTEGSATPAPAPAAAPTAGRWTWTWVWTRGDGWSQSYSWDQPCTCSWAWTWAWTWDAPETAATATPESKTTTAGSAKTDAGADPAAPQVAQTNSSSAVATTSTSSVATQASAGAGAESDSRSIDSEQVATAVAQAEQLRPLNTNLVTAGTIDTVAQVNAILADALASTSFEVDQALARDVAPAAEDVPPATASARQTIASTQTALASATGTQTDPSNVDLIWSRQPSTAAIGAVVQQNTAAASSVAAVDGLAEQIALQTQGGADQTTDVTQSILTTQAAGAAADAGQTRVENLNDVEIPQDGVASQPISQSNDASASARATATSSAQQFSLQVADADGFALHESATQTATVKQSGDAADSAEQIDRTSRAGWRELLRRVEAEPAGHAQVVASPDAPSGPGESADQPAAPAVTSSGEAPGARPRTRAASRPGLDPAGAVRISLAPVAAPATRGWNHAPAVPRRTTFGSTAGQTLAAFAPAARFAPVAQVLGESQSPAPAARGHSERAPTGPAPACGRCPGTGSILSTGGAHGDGGAVAALTSRYKLAAPGAGRPHGSTSTLGRLTDIAPIERPG